MLLVAFKQVRFRFDIVYGRLIGSKYGTQLNFTFFCGVVCQMLILVSTPKAITSMSAREYLDQEKGNIEELDAPEKEADTAVLDFGAFLLNNNMK